MSINVGSSEIKKIFVGGESIKAVYIGSERVWTSGVPTLVAVGEQGLMYYSIDGTVFTQTSCGLNNAIYQVCYDRSKFWTAIISAIEFKFIYSYDGIIWTTATKSVSFQGNVYVSAIWTYKGMNFISIGSSVIAESGTYKINTDYTLTLLDNLTYSGTSIKPVFKEINGRLYRDDKYSTDGHTWTDVSKTGVTLSSGDYAGYQGIEYGNGIYVLYQAIYSSSGTFKSMYILTSTDGINFSWIFGQNASLPYQFKGMAYGNGKFIGIASGASYYSINGKSWTISDGDYSFFDGYFNTKPLFSMAFNKFIVNTRQGQLMRYIDNSNSWEYLKDSTGNTIQGGTTKRIMDIACRN